MSKRAPTRPRSGRARPLRELGWESRDITESIRDTLAWMRERGL